jgi:hypothetical protein
MLIFQSSEPLHHLVWFYTVCWLFMRSICRVSHGLETEEQTKHKNGHWLRVWFPAHLIRCLSFEYSRSCTQSPCSGINWIEPSFILLLFLCIDVAYGKFFSLTYGRLTDLTFSFFMQYVSFVVQVVLRAFAYAVYAAFLLHK